MEHSRNFEKVKTYYDLYLSSDGRYGWSKEKVQKAVERGWITPEEYAEIVGEDYS